MSPVSLLFSSDEETSRRLVQALRELELEIEPCPDIFTAVEWLTSRSFDVIVADWDSGPEAAFLLKNARELKLNKAAFTLALTSGTSNPTAEEDGPDLVLTKPLEPDQVKYAVLSNDRFLGCMKAWIARGDFAQSPGTTRAVAKVQNVVRAENVERRSVSEQPSPEPLAARPPEPSPDPGHSRGETSAPLHLTFATFDRRLFRSLNQRNHAEHVSGKVKRYSRNRFLWGAFLTVAFLSFGYTFGQPLRVQSVFASVATAYKQALEMKSGKLQSSEDATDSDSALAQAAASRRAGSGRYPSSRLRTVPLQTDAPVRRGSDIDRRSPGCQCSPESGSFPNSRVADADPGQLEITAAGGGYGSNREREAVAISTQPDGTGKPARRFVSGIAVAESRAQLSRASFESRSARRRSSASLD